MKFSNFFYKSFKEVPKDAQIISHQLMLRTSMIKQHTSGIYVWLPLGLKVLKNIENIVRRNQDLIGCNEILMPTIQSSSLWIKSGRYNDYGKELLKFNDRHDNELLYGPTNEEMITDFFNDYVSTYKQLPSYLYQFQWKFRDEVRPRFGIMRGREFLMKDAYSFDLDEHSAIETYKLFFKCYMNTLSDMGLKPIPVRADSGAIGGNYSHEFQILAETGESELSFDKRFLEQDVLEKNYEYLTSLYSASDELIDPNISNTVSGRGIEVGHIFYFGSKYTKSMNQFIIDKDGKKVFPHMGSYGIGISRLSGAIIEAFHDEKGIKWPYQIAPFKIQIILGDNTLFKDNDIFSLCEVFEKKYKDILIDDRDITFGKKINDAELMGTPWILIIGKKYKDEKKIELINRHSEEKLYFSIDEIKNFDFK